MKANIRNLVISAGLGLVLMAGNAGATLTITTGDATMGSHGSNLIVNGSFETGNTGIDTGWTPGTHDGGYPGTEVATIPGWTTSWSAGAYGWWGPLGFSGDPAPDGLNMIYFGNAYNTVGTTAAIAANGVITFAGTPTLADRPGPVIASQTVSGLSTSSSYLLDFWVSGELNGSGFTQTGLFGLDITGEGLTYLLLPASSNSFGLSQRYYVVFTPSASTITITFLNWGHIYDIDGYATELVLDDVILNEQSTVAVQPTIWSAVKGMYR